jgi:hypothetical protein
VFAKSCDPRPFQLIILITVVPPIILASFAMQESSCNPSAVGGAGEQGLMQITRDKCKGAPNGNCKDIVSFLIHDFKFTHQLYSRTSISGPEPNFLPVPWLLMAAMYSLPSGNIMAGSLA